VTKHDQREAEGNSQKKSQNKAVRALKFTGKLAWKSTAGDVLVRDAKRVKPLRPDLWKDVFSRKGWEALKRLGTGSSGNAVPVSDKSKKAVRRRIIWPALACALIGFAVMGYGLMFMVSLGGHEAVPTTNKVIAVTISGIGGLYGAINLTTLIVAIHRGLATKAHARGATK